MPQSATPTDKPVARRARKVLVLTLILLTIALALPAGASAFISSGGHGWFTQSSGTTAHLLSVDFIDAGRGWAVGTGGTILATTNGGATWSAQTSGTTEVLWRVAFPDATHGWAVGENGAILATTNGGATWSAQTAGTAHNLSGVAFSDATHGWAVGSKGTILATTDGGGASPTPSPTPTPTGDGWFAQTSGSTAYLDAFVDAKHGWAVGDKGAILATADGGGPSVKARYKVTPPAVPSRVRAGEPLESWGTVKPALTGGDRIVVFWEHFIGGRWDMVMARKPAASYRTVASSTRYSVSVVFNGTGKWRVRSTAGNREPVTSAVRKFTVY